MAGCLIGLVVGVVAAVVGLIRFTIMLMATSTASLFVGPSNAADSMADSWIDQSTAQGVNLGYNPVTRNGARVAAWVVLIFGWLVTIGLIYWIVTLFANQ